MAEERSEKTLSILPPEIEELVTSFEFVDSLSSISQKYGLLEEKIKNGQTSQSSWFKFVQTISAVLKGDLQIGDLAPVLAKELGIDPKTSLKISQEAQELIFSKVEKQIQRLYQIKRNILPGYPQQEVQKIYEGLPQELKQALFSEQTQRIILSACQKAGLKKQEKISQVNGLVFEVLMGFLPADQFSSALKQRLRLKPDSVQGIDFTVQRFVFAPLKEALGALYGQEFSFGPKAGPSIPSKTEERAGPKDVYREPIGRSE